MKELDLNLVDALDPNALKIALGVQIPLKEHLGTVPAALLGMHTYLYVLTENQAHIDRILTQVAGLPTSWDKSLEPLVHQSAAKRLNQDGHYNADAVYLSEAASILTLAGDVLEQSGNDKTEILLSYQVYACAKLLGSDNRPPFFNKARLDEYLADSSVEPATLFMRQFSGRLRKPSLIRRELERYFAPLPAVLEDIDLNLLNDDTDD